MIFHPPLKACRDELSIVLYVIYSLNSLNFEKASTFMSIIKPEKWVATMKPFKQIIVTLNYYIRMKNATEPTIHFATWRHGCTVQKFFPESIKNWYACTIPVRLEDL